MEPQQIQDSNDTSFEESVVDVLRGLPAPIQNYIVQRKYSALTQSLMGKYQLRVDQAAVLEKEIMLLLMGIDEPGTFAAALLEEAQMSQEVVQSIMIDVNEQVFVPLQNEMRAATQTPTPAPRPPAAAVPQYVAPAPVQAPMPQPPRPAPQPPVPQQAPQPRPYQAARPMAAAPANLPGAPRFDQMLEDREEPHINVGAPAAMPAQPAAPRPSPVPPQQIYTPPTPPAPPQPRPPMPQPQFQAPPRPAQPPQQPQQSYMRPNPPAPPAPRPIPTPPSLPPMPRAPQASPPILKDYGIDPYREIPE